MQNENLKKLILASIAVAINVVFGFLVSSLSIPLLFLDSLGTIYIASQIGLSYGILTGVATNLVLSMISGFSSFPFAIISVLIAIIVYFMSRNGFSLKKAIITGIILGFTISIVATPIRIFLFGGLTGSGTDLLILTLKQSGQSIFSSSFFGVLGANLVDKTVSCVLVSLVLKKVTSQTSR